MKHGKTTTTKSCFCLQCFHTQRDVCYARFQTATFTLTFTCSAMSFRKNKQIKRGQEEGFLWNKLNNTPSCWARVINKHLGPEWSSWTCNFHHLFDDRSGAFLMQVISLAWGAIHLWQNEGSDIYFGKLFPPCGCWFFSIVRRSVLSKRWRN